MFSLLSSEYGKFSYELTSEDTDVSKIKDEKISKNEQEINERLFQLEVVNSDDSIEKDDHQPASGSESNSHNAARSGLNEGLRLQKQRSSSQDITSFEVEEDHNSTVS